MADILPTVWQEVTFHSRRTTTVTLVITDKLMSLQIETACPLCLVTVCGRLDPEMSADRET